MAPRHRGACRVGWCGAVAADHSTGGALQLSTELLTEITVAGGVASNSNHRGAGGDPGLTARCRMPCLAGRRLALTSLVLDLDGTMGEQSRSLGGRSESRRAAASARRLAAAAQKLRRPSQRRDRSQLVASSSWLWRRSLAPQARTPRKSERLGTRRQWRRRTARPLLSGNGATRLLTRCATRGSSEARSSARCRGERQPSEEEGDGPSMS